MSIRPGWFYHAKEDARVKTPEKLVDIYFSSVGRNGVLLLNIPPDRRGLIHENDARRLKELGDRLRATFAVNFATGKNFVLKGTTTDDHAPGPGLTTDNDASAEFIEYDLGGPNTFNVARIRENIRYGQRVEAFALDAWDGDGLERDCPRYDGWMDEAFRDSRL